jgi:hypothetical protein
MKSSIVEQKFNSVLNRLFKLFDTPSRTIRFDFEEGIWHDLAPQDVIYPLFLASILHAKEEHSGLFLASVATAETDGKNIPILSVLPNEGKVYFAGTTPFSKIVFYSCIADSLQLIADELSDTLGDEPFSDLALQGVLRKFKKHLTPLFLQKKAYFTYMHLTDKTSLRALAGVMTEEELAQKQESLYELYVKAILKKAETKKDSHLQKMVGQLEGMGWEAKAKICAELISPKLI